MVLTLYSLENSRAFRVHWLINELDVDVPVKKYKRIEGRKAEPAMAKESGYRLGKSPCLVEDGDEQGQRYIVAESGNCLRFVETPM